MLVCYHHGFSNFWLVLCRCGKWITNFLWHDLLLRLPGGLGIFYVVKWNFADDCCIRQRWFCLPMETVSKAAAEYWCVGFPGLKVGISWTDLKSLLIFLLLPLLLFPYLWFLSRAVILLCLTDANWKWQSQGCQQSAHFPLHQQCLAKCYVIYYTIFIQIQIKKCLDHFMLSSRISGELL